MTLACPHCSQLLEFTPEVLASLHGHSECACPHCGGMMAVPQMSAQAAPQPTRKVSAPAVEASSMRKTAEKLQAALHGRLRILGVVALVVIGAAVAYVVLRRTGDTHLTKRHIIEEIIKNKFFTDLIASGATTKEALLGLADLQPHGVGFIGLTEERRPWAEAPAMAERLGAKVLTLDPPDATARRVMLRALTPFTADHLAETLWLLDHGQPKVFEGEDVHRVSTLERPRRVLLAWNPIRK